MELEQRVKALEQEVEILKNQIQATLLDIREMLLTSAYPSLRTGDDAKQPEPKRPTRAAQPIQEPSEDDAPDETPMVRKVVLENAQAESDAPKGRVVKAVRQATPPEDDDTPPERTTAQSKAVKPARQVSPPAYDADQTEEVETNPKPVVRKVALNDEQTATSYQNSKARSTFDAEQANLEAWVHNKVEQVGIERTWELIQLYSQKGHITSEIKDMLLQALSPYLEQAKSERSTPRRPPVDENEEPGENTQRLVLKLIAGVQNAGVGLVRRKARNG